MNGQDDSARGSTRRDILRASALTGVGAALGGLTPFSKLAYGATTPIDSTTSFTPSSIFFNAHHSPIGAYATFTLGYPGAHGGFGQQQKLPGAQSTYVGVAENGAITALPFFDPAISPFVGAYAQSAIGRDFRAASDTFTSPDFSFTLFSPVRSIPNPTGTAAGRNAGALTGISTAGTYKIQDVVLPAVFAEIVVDNASGTSDKVVFFAVTGGNAAVIDGNQAGVTFTDGTAQTAIVTDHAHAVPFTGSELGSALTASEAGALGGILLNVKAGRTDTIRFALCFYTGGAVTSGARATSFWYTKYYPNLASVIAAATSNLAARVGSFAQDNLLVDNAAITANQKFLLSQAIHSYYGNTAFLLTESGAPWWLVLEGQYQYMNTFDLTVDQLFFELGMNPWTVRNVLENVSANYSYQSGTEVAGGTGAGGISFTHDEGQWPVFSPNGSSAYEKPNTKGTFSFMTGEQLTNWTLIAGVYIAQTLDFNFYERYTTVFEQIVQSLANRDNPVASQRDGIESYNSNKCGTGYEITTYDSVGPGLTEAVGNTYLGGKEWACYVILELLLLGIPNVELAGLAVEQATRAANTLAGALQPGGFIASNVYNGEKIPIIPVVEALVYPYFAGRPDAVSPDGLYGNYIKALRTHLTTVLTTQYCVYPNGGWKLDSQSDNTWLSKIFLNEFVGRQILGLDIRASTDAADAQSVYWLTETAGALDCFGDQVIEQVPAGSLYYPRGVTGIVWLQEPPAA